MLTVLSTVLGLIPITPTLFWGSMGLLEERETRLAALRQALKEGEDSGRADYSLQGLLDELDRESPN
jgi:hypothetical protein